MAYGTLSPFDQRPVLTPDPFATARRMAHSAGFGPDLARFIVATARGDLPLAAGAA